MENLRNYFSIIWQSASLYSQRVIVQGIAGSIPAPSLVGLLWLKISYTKLASLA